MKGNQMERQKGDVSRYGTHVANGKNEASGNHVGDAKDDMSGAVEHGNQLVKLDGWGYADSGADTPVDGWIFLIYQMINGFFWSTGWLMDFSDPPVEW